MKLTCASCQQPIVLDDAKIPQGVFKVKCPKCGKIVTGQKDAPGQSPAPTGPAVSAADELQAAYGLTSSEPPAAALDSSGAAGVSPEVQAIVKREVARLRKEILGSMSSLFGGTRHLRHEKESGEDDEDDEFGKKALVCEDDPAFVEIISGSLKRMGYKIETAGSTAEALKKVETGTHDLVTVDYNFPDDKEGGVKIIAKINGQKPALRRERFVVLISANVKSADASAAFFHGANITVNKEEIRHLEHLIRDGQHRFRDLYRVFNRIVEEKNEKL